jgi:hypothetical protein
VGLTQITQTSVTTSPFKRSRKKKTLAQLKEEESVLLKERNGLRNELATMQDLLKQQRARNESLKKLQVNFIFRFVILKQYHSFEYK